MRILAGLIGLTVSLFSSVAQAKLQPWEQNNIKIYNETVGSVVNVSSITKARTWEYGTVDIPRGAGSGFVWNDDGYIITNYHVVQDSDKFMISFYNEEKQYEATLIGAEPNKDIAVLKLKKKPKKLVPVKVGQSKSLLVGQGTIAIGNPFGLDYTMTSGIVSALGRKIDSVGGAKIHDVIQTDADINPGNSGGPLVNTSGELIGMNTMIISRSGSSSGLGFAVPVDTINRVVPQIIKYGKVIRPALGITIVPDHIGSRYNLRKGIAIGGIQEGGPADIAGLEGMKQDSWGRIYLGDVILKINEKEINSFDDIYQVLEKYKIGDEVEVEYLRERKKKKTKLKLSSI